MLEIDAPRGNTTGGWQEGAHLEHLRDTMTALVAADEAGRPPEVLTLGVGFSGEKAEFKIENSRVWMRVQDAEGRHVQIIMPWPSAQTLGTALVAAADAIAQLP